jgi:signal transduction histidine kinase/ligand-binding sensor domain-containing protein
MPIVTAPARRLSGCLLLAMLALFQLPGVVRGQIPSLSIDLPVTNGLIRWWPNIFDVRDEITGQEGAVMGVLPSVETGSVDRTTFGNELGFLLLQPAITNQVFTISFWVRLDEDPEISFLITQEGRDSNWSFMTFSDRGKFYISRLQNDEVEKTESVLLPTRSWHHVVIARRSSGRSLFWLDGELVLDAHLSYPWPMDGRWLTIGSPLNGIGTAYQFAGVLQDLCAFDRILATDEVHALFHYGVRPRAALNTNARLRATHRPVPVLTKIENISPRPQAWVHQRFTTEDNLPANNVKAVLQSKDGYLWVGTEDGLARFDGRHFRQFTADNTPALKAIGQTVWSLSQDSNETIWAGIFGGLLRIQGLEFTAFTNGLPQRFILQAEPAGDDSLWIAAFNASLPRGPLRLRRFYPRSGISTAETIIPGHVRRMISGNDGVWLATEQPEQIHFWDGFSDAPRIIASIGTHGVVRFALNQATDDAEFAVPAEGAGDGYWGEIRLKNAPVFSWLWSRRIYAGRWTGPSSGDFWLGASYNLSRLENKRTEKITFQNRTSSPEVTSLCANSEGGVWFGTEGEGLHLVKERLVRTFTMQDGLIGNDVRSLSQGPNGEIWATTDLGLFRYQNGEWEAQGDSRAPLRSVNVDESGHPWFSRAEFGSTALRRDRFTSEGNHVFPGLDWQDPNTLRFLRDASLWVVCERGVTWIKPQRLVQNHELDWIPLSGVEPAYGRIPVESLAPGIVPLGLVEDSAGFLWVGSKENGVFRVNRNGKIEKFGEKNAVPGKKTVPVLCDKGGALWITSDIGVTRQKNGVFQTIRETNGLPRDNFLDMIEDDLGNLWITGKRGIHRLKRADAERFFSGETNRVFALSLGLRDGLLTPECSSLHYPTMSKSQDGHIWVATRNGVATFDPARVSLNTQPVPAFIGQLIVRGREALSSNPSAEPLPIRLPSGSGERLEFHFGAVSFSAPDKLQFSYRLDGYDSDWSQSSDGRVAFYTNLRPGQYRFRVKAANAYGIWNEHDTSLAFSIAPFFWQTSVFQFGLVMGLIGIVALLHVQRLNTARSRQEFQHQKALINEKTRIAADMHDELGATLTQIAILGEIAKTQIDNPSQTKSTLERISEAARAVTSGMSELVWATNPRNDSLDNLVAYLREQAASQLADKGVKGNIDFPAEVPVVQVSATFRRNLLLVVREMVHNILKHSDATNVTITLRATINSLTLTLKDNGKGFDMVSSRRGNGIGNMQKRIEDLNGQLVLRSEIGQGVTAQINLPLLAARNAKVSI